MSEADTGALVAASPVYAKQHSYGGEWVLGWAWADAYQRNAVTY